VSAAPSILAVASGITGSGQPIPGAVREVEELHARYANVDNRILGDRAVDLSEETLGARDLLHIAAHVQINDQAPWQSEIQLYAAGDARNLSAGQIARMKLSTRLVVLSSCESATGRVLAGEGVLGLTSACLSAGAVAVVATLWPVDDRTTVDFMMAFYAELAAGETVGTALASARETMRRRPATSHPFHWAGFTLVGDGDLRFQLQRRRGLRPPFYLALIPIALLGGWVLLHLRATRDSV
jgi:CHAT domain-containing protein